MRRKTCTYKIGSITRWHYDRDDKGTVRRRGGGGEERVKERTGSSYAEDARRENLEVIRRRRIWPDDAVNGSLSQQGVFKPTLWPSSRVARRCATYRIALLSPHQQTTNPRKKKFESYALWVSEQSFPGGSSQRRIPEACCRVEKKNKTKGSEERTEGGTSPGADNFDSASRLRREYETRRRGPRRGRTRAWSNPASGSLSLTRGKERVVWEREREVGKRKVRKGERERETGRK